MDLANRELQGSASLLSAEVTEACVRLLQGTGILTQAFMLAQVLPLLSRLPSPPVFLHSTLFMVTGRNKDFLRILPQGELKPP